MSPPNWGEVDGSGMMKTHTTRNWALDFIKLRYTAKTCHVEIMPANTFGPLADDP